jgi:hypothetical protein
VSSHPPHVSAGYEIAQWPATNVVMPAIPVTMTVAVTIGADDNAAAG